MTSPYRPHAERFPTNRLRDELTSFRKLTILSRPRLRHYHYVLELQIVVEFALAMNR
ncbi:MAG: hypothetical protein HYZ37_00945 [Candidatus Solibacter usitatus]|nr:hypothetical protein [Candidatus Solibacter usitatus]